MIRSHDPYRPLWTSFALLTLLFLSQFTHKMNYHELKWTQWHTILQIFLFVTGVCACEYFTLTYKYKSFIMFNSRFLLVVLTAPGWCRSRGVWALVSRRLTPARTPDHSADGGAAQITAHWLLINTVWSHIGPFECTRSRLLNEERWGVNMVKWALLLGPQLTDLPRQMKPVLLVLGGVFELVIAHAVCLWHKWSNYKWAWPHTKT